MARCNVDECPRLGRCEEDLKGMAHKCLVWKVNQKAYIQKRESYDRANIRKARELDERTPITAVAHG